MAKHGHNTHTPTHSDRVPPAQPFSAIHNETAQHETAHWCEGLCVCERKRKETRLQQNSDKLNLVIAPKDEELRTMGAVNLNSFV